MTRTIARWSSRGGRWWLELIENADDTYSYRHESGGGYMGRISIDEAYHRMRLEVDSYATDGHKLRRTENKGEDR
jgi:hypothetical protein